jgi:hypothetical protein
MNKATLNYWIDAGIGVTFVASAISGLVFLLPTSVGAEVLGLSYAAWNQLHTWSSLAMIAGVVAHFALHWTWLVCMTKKIFLSPRTYAPSCPQVTGGALMNRRRFLYLGGLALGAGILGAGYKAAANHWSTTSTPNSVNDTSACVTCPKGLVNDPYPGRCHLYIDTNGDGFCDYSTSESCNLTQSNSQLTQSSSQPLEFPNFGGRGNRRGNH